jgi:D-amino-acid dehydrogenase
MRATVIGGGISGVTTAYYLAREGYDVTVIERERYTGMGTSYANGSQLSASNAETWNSWSNMRKGLKWLFEDDAPLKISLKPEPAKIGWMARFIANIPNQERNTVRTCEMALQAHDYYREIADQESIEFDRVEKGILHIYRNERDLQHARRVNELYTKAGLDRREVTAQEMRQIEPALEQSETPLVGGFYNEQDFTGDIHLFCRNLSRVLKHKYGVKFIKLPATIYDIDHFRSMGPVVICAGVESRNLARAVGDRLPIYPVKGYSITVQDPKTGPWVSLLDDETKIVSARLGENRFRAAGTAEFVGENLDIKHARTQPIVDWTRTLFPEMNTEYVTPWAGLRPMTPSMMPIVKPSKHAHNVYYNTGHGHLGWTLSAYTAKQIVDIIGETQ